MEKKRVRTRIAPSPTGDPHVGTAYIALFNLAFAKKHGGDFLLRIEDTDQERFVEGALDIIYHTLKETGLVHDEGPDKDGGFGPYVQSERVASGLYMDYAKKKTGIGKIVYPTGDYEKDMAEIMAFYAEISAKFPQKFSVDTRYHSDSMKQEIEA